KAIPVQTDPRDGGEVYFRQVSHYIHLNPFRAKLCGVGMAKPLHAYPWSSYPAYVGKTRPIPDGLVRRRVLKGGGLVAGEPVMMVAYRRGLDRGMSYELGPAAGRRGHFASQRPTGWFVGWEEFRERLVSRLDGGKGG